MDPNNYVRTFIFIASCVSLTTQALFTQGKLSHEDKNGAKKRLFADTNDENNQDTDNSEKLKTNTASRFVRLVVQNRAKDQRIINSQQAVESEPNDASANSDNSYQAPRAVEQRSTPLRGVFTRNYKKLLTQIQQDDHDVILREAQRITPYLTAIYQQSYDTDPQKTPTPKKSTERHTKSRKKTLSEEHIRQLAHEHLTPAVPGWSATIPLALGYGPIYQNDQLIDPWQLDEEGNINLHRMMRGLAPIGPDGTHEPINLHHVIQGVDAGPLIELSGTTHRRESGILHRGAPGIENRNNFDEFRRRYYEGRAYDLLESMP